ncbi:sigma-70 family RNA polymerase sigma factor [Roseiconus nitratireducens]|uniref:Sigma-70 family RNA polymerase sigma factor n=2 Tax=Roseiconus nitratireducens TaxID=2605748 RepID=A0A5M6D2C4_9BACT|nr:sigma-70 family RNA polymerase sigma factor [Roseiconus nitratireducens]
MLLAFLRTIVDDPATIDDLYQETMLVAWRRLEEVDLSKPFGPWLRGVAGKLVLAHYRKQKALPSFWSEEVLAHIEGQFRAISIRAGDTWEEKIIALHECVEALSTAHRQAIRGRYFRGLSVEELADLLETSVDACKKRLVRARKLLAECLTRKKVFSASGDFQ